MQKLLEDLSYKDKFYLQLSQYAKFSNNQLSLKYFGALQIKCVDLSFAFNKLNSFNPRSIIIASGTLTPIDGFKQQIGLPQYILHWGGGSVIKDENVLVRTATTDLSGHGLQIKSGFFTPLKILIE